MKIAYFTDTYLPEINGVTNTLKLLGHYLDNTVHDSLFLVPEYMNSSPTQLDNVHRFKSIPFPFYNECRLSIPTYGKLSKKVNAFKPDLIHIVTPLGIGHAGVRYAKEYNIPMVSSFHTNFDTYLKYYNMQHFKKYLWHFFKNFHNQFIINFCPSTNTLKHLQAHGIKNLKIWSRGIDTSIYSPKYKNKDFFNRFRGRTHKGKITFLYTGRLALEKDLDILFESIKILNADYCNKIEFIIVGDGPERERLEQYGYDNVYFTGYLSGQALSNAYASADIFVFPSSTETLGNVVLEAMASGLPVIGVQSGGVIDNIIHDYNGILVEPRNSMSLSLAMKALIECPAHMTSLQKNALDYVKTKGWDSIFNQLMADYTVAIEKTTARSDDVDKSA